MLENIEVFAWSKNLELGIEIIDKQHKHLVDLINKVAVSYSKHDNNFNIDFIFNELLDYADYHFKSEELVWSKINDSCVADHKHTHDSFVNKLNDLITHKDSDLAIEEILTFLIKWLAYHILDNDKRMSIILKLLNDGYKITDAKKTANEKIDNSMHIMVQTVLGMYEKLSSNTLSLMKERIERKRIEDILKEKEKKERLFADAIIKGMPNIVIVSDANLNIIRTNQEWHYKTLQEIFGNMISDAITEINHHKKYVFEAEINNDIFICTGIIIHDYQYLISCSNITNIKNIEKQLLNKNAEYKRSLLGTITAVSKALELRDPYTAGHQQRVAKISVLIAEELGLDQHTIEGIRLGASIHDIGKIAVPSELLVKPTRLSDLEYELIKTHGLAGELIFLEVPFPWPITNIVTHHHEHLDGSGYPHGLIGDEISLEVRIVSVADTFEAISSHRPYRPALGHDIAIKELLKYKGIWYDSKVIDALIEVIKKYPEL